ncbi:unnamed protein product, partial [Staurois parvus]
EGDSSFLFVLFIIIIESESKRKSQILGCPQKSNRGKIFQLGLVLVTWGSPRDSLNFQGFPLTSCLVMGRELRGNLCNHVTSSK